MFPGFTELVAARGIELGQPVSDEDVTHAENLIGVRLPPSYHTLLTEYGVLEPIFDPVQVEAYTLRLRREMGFPDHLIPFYETEDEAFACFDASRSDVHYEYPVVFIDFAEVGRRHYSAIPADYPFGRQSFVDFVRDELQGREG